MNQEAFQDSKSLTTTGLGELFVHLEVNGWKGEGEKGFRLIPRQVFLELRSRIELAYHQVLLRVTAEEASPNVDTLVEKFNLLDGVNDHNPVEVGASWLLTQVLQELSGTEAPWAYEGSDNPLPSNAATLAIHALDRDNPRFTYINSILS